MQDITLLREALPYIRRFRGTTFVIKIGGESLKDRETLIDFAEDVALISSVGIRVVIVHGGGAQITDTQATLGIETKMVGGRRITDERTLDVVKMVLAGKMSVEIVAALKRQGVRALGTSTISAGIIEARRRPPRKVSGGGEEIVDFGFVGDIVSADLEPLVRLLDSGIVPVLSPLGADSEGNIYNMNADLVASRIAAEFKAEKLLLLTAVPGVMMDLKDRTTLISQITASEAREAIRKGMIAGGMIPKVEESLRALEAGVKQVHILSAMEPHQLMLEIFTPSGCGTMLLP